MNRKEIISALAIKTSETQEKTEKFYNAFKDLLVETLSKGEKVQMIGFGSFSIKIHKAREARDPKTRENICCYQEKGEIHTWRYIKGCRRQLIVFWEGKEYANHRL